MKGAGAACALALWLCVAGAAGQVYSTLAPGFRCAVQDSTCASLGDFYAATRGGQWRNATGWSAAAAGTPVDYCTLPFVKCNSTTGQVVSLCVLGLGRCGLACLCRLRTGADSRRGFTATGSCWQTARMARCQLL